MISLRVSELRQYSFCPRVVWYRQVLGQPGRETGKMAQGRDAEAALQKLEVRRRLHRYGLEEASRRFDVPLQSEVHGLHGICDLVLELPGASPEAPRRAYPVEVKTTRGGVGRHHVVQLAAYALMLEASGVSPVERGYVLLLPADRVVEVPLGERERALVLRTAEAIRTMISCQRFPRATRYESFCPDCEFVNFCGDVL
ncbi:CRISPR-associated protein Cas4 [Chondromyces crocatus]|uniref:CRISPR-associated exonuclease Cas4 n=1 Tax=Chondromyces crocatus TaxID=52 RepID=A0A0K1ECB7_CHOCO|nr:CRISPR-associated protein Cas4 [Chondromyces crocatus]AKT38515.1 CRISPR-associated protein Cas4 [Chondromyces crocatus]